LSIELAGHFQPQNYECALRFFQQCEKGDSINMKRFLDKHLTSGKAKQHEKCTKCRLVGRTGRMVSLACDGAVLAIVRGQTDVIKLLASNQLIHSESVCSAFCYDRVFCYDPVWVPFADENGFCNDDCGGGSRSGGGHNSNNNNLECLWKNSFPKLSLFRLVLQTKHVDMVPSFLSRGALLRMHAGMLECYNTDPHYLVYGDRWKDGSEKVKKLCESALFKACQYFNLPMVVFLVNELKINFRSVLLKALTLICCTANQKKQYNSLVNNNNNNIENDENDENMKKVFTFLLSSLEHVINDPGQVNNVFWKTKHHCIDVVLAACAKENCTALMEILIDFLKRNNNCDESELQEFLYVHGLVHAAAGKHNCVETMRLLAQHVPVKASSIRDMCIRHWFRQVLVFENIHFLVSQGADGTPVFLQAVKEGNIPIVCMLLQNGVDIHYEQDMALETAMVRNYQGEISIRNADMIYCLLEHGADITAIDPSFRPVLQKWLMEKNMERIHYIVHVLLEHKHENSSNDGDKCDMCKEDQNMEAETMNQEHGRLITLENAFAPVVLYDIVCRQMTVDVREFTINE